MKLLPLLPLVALTGSLLLASESVVSLKRKGPVPLGAHVAARPLTLDEAVQLALWQNPMVLAAEQEIERTRGQVIEVRAQAFPQLTVTSELQQQDRSLSVGQAASNQSLTSGTASSTSNSTSSSASASVTPVAVANGSTGTGASAPTAPASPTPPATSASTSTAAQNFVQNKTWEVTLQARQLLYSGGQLSAGIRIAKLVEDQSAFKLRDAVDSIIAVVRQEFYTVLVNKALIGVQQEQVTLLESQLQDQKNRFEAGAVPRFNVLQAEVALANAQPALIQARNNYHIAQLQLAKTLGYETNELSAGHEPFALVGELTIPPVYTDLARGLQLARQRRPFLKAQRQNILINVENITVAAAGYKPSVSALAGFTVENNHQSHSLSDAVNGWFFGIQGSWAVFDGFATYGNIKQAKAQMAEARINYEDSVQQVDLEVQQSWANLQQAKETIASQRKNVEEATEAVRLARERLAAGAGTQLDVLNSTVALAQAHTTELQARLGYNTALFEFERVTAADTKYNETFDDPLLHKCPVKCKKRASAAP